MVLGGIFYQHLFHAFSAGIQQVNAIIVWFGVQGRHLFLTGWTVGGDDGF